MDLPRTLSLIHDGIASRLHLGCQLYASIHGQAVVDLALGEARPDEPLTRSHLMLWLSAGKPLAAIAIAQLWEQGKCDLDDPVARHIPEFAQRGKESVTIRHLLTHTAGFRGAAASWSAGSWDQILHRIYNAPLESGWTPGQKAGYHVASSWYVLGELVHRFSGQPYDQYLRDHIFLPLAMTDCWMRIPPDTVPTYATRIAPIYNTQSGGFDDAYPGNSESSITSTRPGAGLRGPAHQFARLYEALLNRGRPVQLLRPQTIEALTSRHRAHMLDHTFGHEMDWSLGLLPNNAAHAPAAPYGYGPHASFRTFGHGGSQSSTAFADPHHGLAVALAFNGMPGEAHHDQRLRAVLAALYEDLGLGIGA
jgi:CubicO group peptidase (beta-lactamase class C family)